MPTFKILKNAFITKQNPGIRIKMPTDKSHLNLKSCIIQQGNPPNGLKEKFLFLRDL